MGWSKLDTTQMARLRAYYLNGGDMLKLARYQEEDVPKAAGSEYDKILSSGRVWAEPSIERNINV